jgi:hypothetical protein
MARRAGWGEVGGGRAVPDFLKFRAGGLPFGRKGGSLSRKRWFTFSNKQYQNIFYKLIIICWLTFSNDKKCVF